MSIPNLWLFAATEAALSLSPGPAVIMTVAYGITRGVRGALWVTSGILGANALYFALSATSLGGLIAASPQLYHYLKWAGAAYLVYLGLSAIFGRPSPITLSKLNVKAQSGWAILRGAALLQLSNPKSLLMFVSILPQFVDPDQPVGMQMVVLAACSIIPEFFILLGYGALASRASHRLTQPEFAVITERVAGCLVLAAGLMVASI